MIVQEVSTAFAAEFLNANHPLRASGALRGALVCLAGYSAGSWPVFVAVFVYPRSRWRRYPVSLELSRLAWSPLAKRSASTFLRKCLRYLRQQGRDGLVVTYAMPGTSGVVYERAGFWHDGYSSGASWARRGPGERPTPNTIGNKIRLKRFFAEISRKESEI
jgi:hypothetical protein